ncbi:3'-5' exonuclease [Tenacibaculum maritimum]|uniref:exonuclease domain-containing protein n=2 Tax=Tenacibaculum maritimum TaxID=107401 RepID=UPI002307B55A|nr:3'-5' exonuclease [Tenacibaculum maritimum]MDB0601967.1 exonuclease domain-containing protein [Tenacibaculum maritimum]MDB0613897.1 exonuclease domain-containing protein [Tenacibaculum maritimum]
MYDKNKIVILDLEATCWEQNSSYQRSLSEIIEIGVCVLDINTGGITQNEGILVKPFKSEVSAFCTELTTLTQEMLDTKGVTLSEACMILREEYKTETLVWASYGEYDKKMLENQCRKWSILYPMNDNHINVKKELSKISMKSMGMERALKYIGIKLDGTHHRGVDDARNIAKILYWLVNNSKSGVNTMINEK